MAAETTKKPCPNQNEENSSHHLSQTTKKSNKKRNETSNIKSQKHTRKKHKENNQDEKNSRNEANSFQANETSNQPASTQIIHPTPCRIQDDTKRKAKMNTQTTTQNHQDEHTKGISKTRTKQNQTSPKASHKQETTMITEPSDSNGSYQPTPRKIPIPSAKWHGRRNAAIG